MNATVRNLHGKRLFADQLTHLVDVLAVVLYLQKRQYLAFCVHLNSRDQLRRTVERERQSVRTPTAEFDGTKTSAARGAFPFGPITPPSHPYSSPTAAN
jgi:hypothetical protein